MKSKYLFFLSILFLISIIFNKFDYLLYPYYMVKDFLYYPVHALKSDVIISNTLKDNIIEGLKDDINNLLKLNEMKLSLSNFNYINATVIERNRDYWFNSITVNRGEDDGIKVDMAVIDADGLVGRISSVTKNKATVKLITTNDTKNKISAVINNNNNQKVYGIINGYDSNNNLLNLIISDSVEIPKNSRVETTGMGGVFPSNILIGNVFDIVKDDDGITNIVKVIPAGDIKGEKYVAILQRKEISNN